jgi:hypothetical protein
MPNLSIETLGKNFALDFRPFLTCFTSPAIKYSLIFFCWK